MIIKLLPGSFRRSMRLRLDLCFCRSDIGLARVGGEAAWSVLPSRLGPGAKVLSGGAGNDISFELNLTGVRGCEVALFDPSPTGAATFSQSGGDKKGLSYYPFGLDSCSRQVSFEPPRDVHEGSYSLPKENSTDVVVFNCLSPKDALAEAGFSTVELVKIDIEGFEYGFLQQMLADGLRPSQIAVEFHHFLPHIPFIRTLGTVLRLYAAGYRIVHKVQCDYLFVHRSVLNQ